MKRFTSIASIFALSLVILALPAITSAQWRDRDHDDDDHYGRNDDDYYRNSRHNGRNIRGTIQSLRNRARNFERRLDRIDDRRDDRWDRRDNRWGRRDRYDNLEALADQFTHATDELADEYRNGRDRRDGRDEARRVLDIGSQIESILNQRRVNRQISNDWNQISYDLRTIANFYGMSYYGDRNRRNGDWRNRIPFPLPF